jgi:RimJ/RimL family protein N-acetyltransferase
MFELREPFPSEVHTLFKEYDYQVSVLSVLHGNLRGTIFVDNPSKPKTGIMMNPEGLFIAGNPKLEAFNTQLHIYLDALIKKGAPLRDTDDLWFYIDHHQWENQFPILFPSRSPFKVGRLHFSIQLPARDWRNLMPKGYQIHRADENFDCSELSFPEDVHEWVEGNMEEYLKRGFGAVLTCRDNVVSWCTADCSFKDSCEIGIITTKDERRKGLGSLTVLAALDFCYKSGFSEVGWHTGVCNLGSIATAKKVGFRKKTDYYAWVCKRDNGQQIKDVN